MQTQLNAEKQKNIKLTEAYNKQKNIISQLSSQLSGQNPKSNKLMEELNKQRNIISQLTSQLNSERQNNLNLNNQLKSYININNQLNQSLNSKITEIQNLKKSTSTRLSSTLSTVKSINPGERVIAVHFTSPDHRINYSLPCKNTDVFVKLEQQLYMEYPEYKNENTYFTVSGNSVKRFKTLDENHIKNHDIILLNVYE